MTPTQIAIGIAIVAVCAIVSILITASGAEHSRPLRRVARHPKNPKRAHEENLSKALAFLDTKPTNTGHIYLRCTDCGGFKFPPEQTVIDSNADGLVCVAVCRLCGAQLVSRVLKSAEAAEYVDAGSPRVWPRMVVWRNELKSVGSATEFSRAVIEAKRTTTP